MTTPAERQSRARSFGAVAELYDRVRPTYPTAALEWALQPLGPGPWRVADVGAGTGIMTRLIAASSGGDGYRVTAVEPDPLMRAQLAATMPGAEVVDGRAESIPVPDGAFDAAIAAQAYHWFDHRAAHAELARVIRAGGVFAAVWNDRDEGSSWVSAYTRIIQGERGPDEAVAPPSFGDAFSPVETKHVRHVTRSTPDRLVELLHSRSYYLTAAPARRQSLEAEVRALVRDHPDLAGRTEFDLPYVTTVYRAVRR